MSKTTPLIQAVAIGSEGYVLTYREAFTAAWHKGTGLPAFAARCTDGKFEQCKATAERIERAWNSHDLLLAACECEEAFVRHASGVMTWEQVVDLHRSHGYAGDSDTKGVIDFSEDLRRTALAAAGKGVQP